MKIRTDFVTNSSSTSFVIIASEELTLFRFLQLMGVEKTSPFVAIFEELFYRIDLKNNDATLENSKRQDQIETRFLKYVRGKIAKARELGQQVYIGEFNSDENTVESFFCTDSFEIDEPSFFFSARECYW